MHSNTHTEDDHHQQQHESRLMNIYTTRKNNMFSWTKYLDVNYHTMLKNWRTKPNRMLKYESLLMDPYAIKVTPMIQKKYILKLLRKKIQKKQLSVSSATVLPSLAEVPPDDGDQQPKKKGSPETPLSPALTHTDLNISERQRRNKKILNARTSILARMSITKSNSSQQQKTPVIITKPVVAIEKENQNKQYQKEKTIKPVIVKQQNQVTHKQTIKQKAITRKKPAKETTIWSKAFQRRRRMDSSTEDSEYVPN
jgi:hypothetical protein